jgi:uncharacterized protein
MIMNREHIVQATETFVYNLLKGECSGHDWWHADRVRKTALFIGTKEGADLFVIELAALLHDIADWKFHDGDCTVGPSRARDFLMQQSVDSKVIDHVASIIRDISFKGKNVASSMQTLEGKVVQDADRLDALGAVGIARVFAYAGHKGHEIYNPDIAPVDFKTFEQYRNSKSTAINHFYEKLLLLKDLMNTPTARMLAHERHVFMESYLKQFFHEVHREQATDVHRSLALEDVKTS